MPIYGYTCDSCEHTFDALQKLSDPKLLDCPECGKASLQKLLSAPKFRLKGAGWYETDFKTGDKRNLVADSEKSTAGATEKSGDADKSAAADKPAKKEEAKSKETPKPETKNSSADSKVNSA
ncbi:MAG: zinc ribbon domain-containing protein [Gammaproteobacteria bacterium]|nr:zinc ribbon domain-containing protein [Gammaproteobacteria bacterium]